MVSERVFAGLIRSPLNVRECKWVQISLHEPVLWGWVRLKVYFLIFFFWQILWIWHTLLSRIVLCFFGTYVNQVVMRFALQDHREFAQRYYEFVEYFEISDRPIFLVIGGESELMGIENDYVGVSCKCWYTFLLLAFITISLSPSIPYSLATSFFMFFKINIFLKFQYNSYIILYCTYSSLYFGCFLFICLLMLF